MKNDHSLFGYIDIDGIIYEIFLIPANHCHVLSCSVYVNNSSCKIIHCSHELAASVGCFREV